MNLAHWLTRAAQATPQNPALFAGQSCIADYAVFRDRAGQLAGWLVAQGVRPGDRVGIFMRNCPEFLIALFGIWSAGAAAVPINAKLHGREAAWILENAGASMCLVTPDLATALAEAETPARLIDIADDTTGIGAAAPLADVIHRGADDLAWLFYTSGTTGRPKGVMITHGMLMAMTMCYFTDVDHVSAADSAIYAAPMSHGAGLYALMHVLTGARHVCPASGGFDPAEIFDLARHFGRAHMFAAPTMVKRLTLAAKTSGETGEGLRSVIYAGGPMYEADIVEAVDHFGPIFMQVYGQGESPMCITALGRDEVADRNHPRWRERLNSVGRAQSLVEVQIGGSDGAPLPAGEVGEIMVRGAAVMPGYWQNPEATEKTLVDGWLMTGDVGRMDADGYVTLQDRSKDVIISGGSNIYPREVEEVLLTHPSVREVSVVGQPDPEWGEIVVAFVVPVADGALDEAALEVHCTSEIARFKKPKRYLPLRELPKNNYGKVLKTELRQMLSET
ncbi:MULTISPECIES: class I adenylate-forming enzyme family protein [unclassified Roseovarius]|uniref:class I adenylate-forming enzyme family protein n=1 Tax=unclassified Roseovarius TaxID=2614913 RepID=UPI00273DCE6F|nr:MULTISPECIES: AMP-binding protein [unclassified Roseovarius]